LHNKKSAYNETLMNSDTFEGSTQESLVYNHLQSLREQHRDELDNMVRVLANITNISLEQVKPYMDTLLQQLISKQKERPFHETATTEEWVTAFREWARNHRHNAPPFSDYGVSRESMYEDEKL
jgi:NAD-specific glutamate dehydrogenase